jgi:hypothetical protein
LIGSRNGQQQLQQKAPLIDAKKPDATLRNCETANLQQRI